MCDSRRARYHRLVPSAPPTPADRRRLLLAWIALAGAVLGPGLPRWGSAFLGSRHTDAWGTQWFYWYAGEVAAGRAGLGHTDLLYHPWGKDLYLHTGGNVLDAFLALPFRALLGPEAGFDLFVALVLLANGLAARRLARLAGAGPLAAGLAGLLFAFDPYALSEITQGRPTQALLVFPTLFVAELLGAPRWRGWGAPLRAGLFLALSGLTYWFYGIFAALAGLVLGLAALVVAPAGRRGAVLGRLLLAAAVAAAVALPFALPMLLAGARGEVPGLLDVSGWSLHGWTPRTVEDFPIAIRALDPLTGMAGNHFLDGGALRWVDEVRVVLVLTAALAALGLTRLEPRLRWTLLAALVPVVLVAGGPVLAPEIGWVDPFYLGLARVFTPFRRLWWPVRAVALLAALLVPAVAAGIGWLAGRGGLRRWVVTALVVGLAGAELRRWELLPLETTAVRPPGWARCLAASGGRGAVVGLPLGPHPERLYAQTVHGHPMLSGMIDDNRVLLRPEVEALERDNPLLRWLDAATRLDGVLAADLAGEDGAERAAEGRARLVELGYRYVVIDREALRRSAPNPELARRLARTARVRAREALGPPVYHGDDAWVYLLDRAPWACADGAGPPR